MAEEILIIRKPTAPTLIAIITMKLFKGTFFVLLALAFYTLSDNNLQWEYSYLLKYFHIDQGRKVFIDFGQRLGNFSETDMLWVAGLTLDLRLVLADRGNRIAHAVQLGQLGCHRRSPPC